MLCDSSSFLCGCMESNFIVWCFFNILLFKVVWLFKDVFSGSLVVFLGFVLVVVLVVVKVVLVVLALVLMEVLGVLVVKS